MFRLTRKSDCGLVAAAALAREAASGNQPLSARQIAQSESLPAALVSNVLKQLHQAGVVASTRGANGGYRLAEEADRISVARIVAAMEGPVTIVQCCGHEAVADLNHGQPHCQIMALCPITAPMRRFHQRISEFLTQVTLASLVEREVGKRDREESVVRSDECGVLK